MKKARTPIKKMLAVFLGTLLILQLLSFNPAIADDNDLTGQTDYLVVHDIDYDPPERASALTITEADGVTVITPDGDGNYNDIPAGAKILLDYAFGLNDGNADHTVTYDYTGDEYFTASLPEGLNFALASGTVVATDTIDGDYDLATWSALGNILTVSLTDETEDTFGKGGAANDAHQDKWGKVHIEGTFQALSPGDDTETEITFGSQTIIIRRQPLPLESVLAKTGGYDASTNKITWTVTVTPPLGDPDLAYDGYSLIDQFGADQTYVADSFTVEGALVPDTDLLLDPANRKITYVFPDTDPDTTGLQIITYKTKPTTFAAEDGAAAEYSTYANTVNLKRGEDSAASEATASVELDWISKSGEMVDILADDPTVVKWTVSITVPGVSGEAISGAVIKDTIPADFELLEDGPHPVQIQFGSDPAQNVVKGINDGEYAYSGNILTYSFPAANQPAAGTTANLTFYTKVTGASWNTYLDTNSGISFSNAASLSWDETSIPTEPSDTCTIADGIGSGGLLSKSAAGGTENYTYSAADPGTIHWIVTVNRNKISIVNAQITDIVPAGQELFIDALHPLTVTRKGLSDTVVDTFNAAVSSGNFTYTDANNFVYQFPEETLGSATITSTYTVDYYMQIIDTVPGTAGDPSGLDTLYKNGTINFGNGVTLTRDAAAVSTNGTKRYNSQLVGKSVATAYDYNTRTVQWTIVVNRNRLLLTDAVLTDTLPDGMTILNEPAHPFSVTAAGGGDTGTLSAASGDTSFTLTLPTPTTDEYTLTFWTLLSEDSLKTQWSGTKDFTNSASLDAKEIAVPVTSTAKVSIVNPVITKEYDYTSGSDSIDWSIVINPAQVLLTNAVVTDVLHSALRLEPDSLKLYTVSIFSANGQVDPASAVLVTSGYTVTEPTPENGNTLTVELPASTSSAYRLDFTTSILTDDIDLDNTVELAGSAGDPSGQADSTQIVVNDLYSSGGSGTNSLTVHKTDNSGDPLAGATFQLLNVNQQPITKNGSIITAVTDAAGDAIFNNLPSWIFYVQEIDPAPGYLIPPDPISGGNRLNGTETLSVTNDLAFTDVSLNKKGANDSLLSGGTFTLIGRDYKDDAVSKTASAVNGVVTFTDVPTNKAGEPYTVTETAVPAGHSLSPATLSATVDYNAEKNGLVATVTPATLVNTPLPATVSFEKLGTGGALLSGGLFTLEGTDYAGSTISRAGVAAVGGTVTFSGVPLGSYTITEDDPPDGYLMPADPTILTATVEYNPDNTGLVVAVRSTAPGASVVTSYEDAQAFGTITFTKTNSADGSLLSGGTFTLTGKDYAGNDVILQAASVGGTVTFTGVPLGDDYTIRETTPPSGFRKTDNVLKASVTYNADKTAVLTDVTPDTLANVPAPPQNYYPKVAVTKTDEDGNRLSGAAFTLYNSAGDIVATAVSDSSGVAMFGYVPAGNGYTIKETKAPDGYELSLQTITLDVAGTGTQTFTMINKKRTIRPGSITVYKTDEDGKALAGAEFTLYDAGGRTLESAVTGAEGRAEFSNVQAGSYNIAETRAPEGYIAATDSKSVDISNGDSLYLTFQNKKVPLVPQPDVPAGKADNGGGLPRAGGFPGTFFMLLAGLILLLAGLILAKPRKYEGKY